MYVSSEYRGFGIADKILDEIEKRVLKTGISKIVQETGIKQTEAIRFYLRKGYIRIHNYGQYEGNQDSVCMEKVIKLL